MKTISFIRDGNVLRISFLLFLLAMYSTVSAHSISFSKPTTYFKLFQQPISGLVKDDLGPIPGVTVQIKGTSITTITNELGEFSILAKAGDILQFHLIGYETVEQIITDNNYLVINLFLKTTELNEAIINAGYYKVKDKDRTGSISRVTAKNLENQPIGNVLSGIQGRMSGVQITQNSGIPGSGYEIQIRGLNSLRREGNYPLYIIDGVPLNSKIPTSLAGTIIPYGEINPLNIINPNDIESIEILKDADATAIYGSRGANGVILITTKKGKIGETKFSINSSFSISNSANKIKLLNTDQYLQMRELAFANDGISELPVDAYDLNGTWDRNHFTDWQKELIGKYATSSNVQFSMNGGTQTTQFLIGGNHSEQTTVLPGDFSFKTNNLTGNLSHISPNKKLEINASGLFSSQSNNIIRTDLLKQALLLAPNSPQLYEEDGSLNWENNTFQNPIANFQSIYIQKSKSFNSNINLNYAIFPFLKLKFNGGINSQNVEESATRPNTMYNPAFGITPASSSINKSRQNLFSYLLEPSLQYFKKLNLHTIDLLIGSTIQQTTSSTLSVRGTGFESNSLLYNLAAANSITISQDSETQYKYAAVFARINYQYKNKYIINLTGRRDGSSRFGPNKRFSNFGAIGAAWIFSKENSIKEMSWLNFGKLRGSYGIAGSDLIGDYQFLDTYNINSTLYGGTSTLDPARLYNPNFSWEKTKKLEIALEGGLFKNKINFTIAWYQNRSDNQLVGIPLPGTTGFSNIQANLPAVVENTGWEFEGNFLPIQSKYFKWETNFNISFPKNKLLSFPGLDGSTYANRYVVGLPTSIVKLYNYEGINQQTGLYSFTDYNEDGNITSPDDNLVTKNIGISYFGGWQNELKYKNWNLGFLFQFVKQNQWNYNSIMPTPGTMNNQPIEILNYWSFDNPNGQYMPFTSGNDPIKNELHNYFMNSTAAVSDASFIRLKNIQLSYHLPLKHFVEDVLIYFQGQNLLTITKYFGIDPEFTLIGYLPPLKTYSFGVQLTF